MTPHEKRQLQRAVADLVEQQKMYEYVPQVKAAILNGIVPVMAHILETDEETLVDFIWAEIKRQRHLRGLCDACGDKTNRHPNLCIQCDMTAFNQSIPRYNWFSPN